LHYAGALFASRLLRAVRDLLPTPEVRLDDQIVPSPEKIPLGNAELHQQARNRVRMTLESPVAEDVLRRDATNREMTAH